MHGTAAAKAENPAFVRLLRSTPMSSAFQKRYIYVTWDIRLIKACLAATESYNTLQSISTSITDNNKMKPRYVGFLGHC
jgi:hypothetical protein